ncbi:MAG TPA: hypothetical protein ENG73_04860 [Desulfobacterales bacterium]|nr:hypothetical protein [Desulfobacterales bacterium]
MTITRFQAPLHVVGFVWFIWFVETREKLNARNARKAKNVQACLPATLSGAFLTIGQGRQEIIGGPAAGRV